jgi:hypothetical protein
MCRGEAPEVPRRYRTAMLVRGAGAVGLTVEGVGAAGGARRRSGARFRYRGLGQQVASKCSTRRQNCTTDWAGLQAARTLFRSQWASWRSTTSGLWPISFSIVDAVAESLSVVPPPGIEPGSSA